uniref:Uncharacterized protein n=1 Tax=Micrurus spixii TaxID=129469 RepID=A0A2D4MWY6_9SAUR
MMWWNWVGEGNTTEDHPNHPKVGGLQRKAISLSRSALFHLAKEAKSLPPRRDKYTLYTNSSRDPPTLAAPRHMAGGESASAGHCSCRSNGDARRKGWGSHSEPRQMCHPILEL